MKQFLRYFLLILTIITFVAWIWSYWREERIGYSDQKSATGIGLNYGGAYFAGTSYINTVGAFSNRDSGWKYYHSEPIANVYFPPSVDQYDFPGFIVATQSHPQFSNFYISIRFWLIFVPLSLITLLLWYPKLKAWRAGTSRKGFEIEIKDMG